MHEYDKSSKWLIQHHGDSILRLAGVRRKLPEVVAVILHPRGNLRVSSELTLASPQGFSRCNLGWRVVELWNVPAEELLASGDVGLIPWVPLARLAEPVEKVLQECRDRIDREAPPEQRANLLAVTQVMTQLRYNEESLLSILGGSQMMLESPLIQGAFPFCGRDLFGFWAIGSCRESGFRFATHGLRLPLPVEPTVAAA